MGTPDSTKNMCMCRYVGAPPPLNEAMRLQTLQAMGILDSAPEKKYEEVTKLLQHLFQAGSCRGARSGAHLHGHTGPLTEAICQFTASQWSGLACQGTSAWGPALNPACAGAHCSSLDCGRVPLMVQVRAGPGMQLRR